MAKSKSVAILAEMGTGKTLISIGIAGYLYLKEKINKLLIVAPLSITKVWEEEFGKFADFDYQIKVLEGSTNKKAETLRNLFGLSVIGKIFTCVGAIHTGNLPAKCSIKIPIKRSIEPNTTRCTIIGRCF